MKKFIKRSIFITIAMLLIFTIKSYAQVTVEGKQEYRQDAYLTVKSTESIENIKIYKKQLFYKMKSNSDSNNISENESMPAGMLY